MKQEARFVLAISLMLVVLVGTNLIFAPEPSLDPVPALDSISLDGNQGAQTVPVVPQGPVSAPVLTAPQDDPAPASVAARDVVVQGPLYTYTFTTLGARVTSLRLEAFASLAADNGSVELIPEGSIGALGTELRVGDQGVNLEGVLFEVTPEDGLRLAAGGAPQELTFRYVHPSGALTYSVTYRFDPDEYLVSAEARVEGLDPTQILTGMGSGIGYNEQRAVDDSRVVGYVVNQLEDGVRAVPFRKVDERRIEEGPLLWAAVKSKYFVMALLPGVNPEDEKYLGGLLAEPIDAENQAKVAVSHSADATGVLHFRLYAGPQNFSGLKAIGDGLENVNPIGWKFMRPVIRPLVGIILKVFNWMHDTLNISYGWVLVVFGVSMRVVLYPLNQKAMRAQMKNMAVQPLLQEIQAKYKNEPEKLQKEMMVLYKEHGFNPVGGCLPMLLPWPVLVTLFFVFRNTIELRGVPFYWLPSLSGPDPIHILPIVMGGSMFLLQWISMRSMSTPNPQMKMMMWMMPIVFTFMFWNFASGLNLYYATANLATLPQQYLIARERKALQDKQAANPVKKKSAD